jgi:hypothetical protein
MESEKVVKYKALISEARDLFTSMTEEESVVCEQWLDDQYLALEKESSDTTLVVAAGDNARTDLKKEEAKEGKVIP